ncbi:M1 family metallopeptidase [Tunturiibacter lichenicola]|uniref:M1 family metallopeptidase n=1 Tax=Tunturiibacter lichenicola TaxID=2051959 RepID=UPI003D9AB88E
MLSLLGGLSSPLFAQTSQPAASSTLLPVVVEPSHADLLRGSYGPYRANNDLLFYRLDIRVDPEKKFISGTNTIRFKMLEDGTHIQLELFPTLQIDKIEMGKTPLKYQRDGGTFFVDFPKTLRTGRTYSIDVHYSGSPVETGRFGCFTFKKDTAGHPWINTACEEEGASVWWPNKDQWRDEPQEGMEINVAVPNGLMDVSNGKFVGKKDLGDGYTRWDWRVHYPINNYDVALNIGNYVHFDDKFEGLPLDYYVLPESLEGAKRQFAQVPGMMKAYYHYFGEYPFKKDGYKLIEVPYAGMEHQSAVAYGNHFANSYQVPDWTGVGISPRFDFIIIHESGHEWFGNAITAADKSDMWIHEGWTTYLECLYVEYNYGHDDEVKYVNSLKKKVKNVRPIISARGTNAEPPQDQYFKGALFINTLRSIVDDDARWFALIHDFYQHFKYQNIMTEDVVQYFNQQTGVNLTPVFDQYLRHTAIPTLELKFDEASGAVQYRWQADEKAFAMPVRVGLKQSWETIHPTADWQTMKTTLTKDQFDVATDLYYINVNKL